MASQHERISNWSDHSASTQDRSFGTSKLCPFQGSPPSSISSAPPSGDESGKAVEVEESDATCIMTTTRMSTYKQEVLEVFGEHSEEFVAVSRNPRAKRKSAESHKHDVFQVFGEDIHGDEELVAVPRKPVVSRQRIEAAVEDPYVVSTERLTDSRDEERPSKSCPTVLERVIARCRRCKNRRKAEFSNK